jgi:epoxide hydrolase-like predicted phosphatase
MAQYDLLLFDLGGVLVYFDGITPLRELTQNRLDSDTIRRIWLESPWTREFQKGHCSPQEFAAGFVQENNLEISPQEFLQQFSAWDHGLMPGAMELLQNLRLHYKIGCLTNNNEIHWNVHVNKIKITSLFHVRYVSHLIGMVKPDTEIFEYVIKDQGIAPERIVYFDDNIECVEGARKTGMVAFQAEGVGQVVERLKGIGITSE